MGAECVATAGTTTVARISAISGHIDPAQIGGYCLLLAARAGKRKAHTAKGKAAINTA